MALIFLPCEIYQREFDGKLLLATRLVCEYGHTVLIGYDKYFNQAIPHLGPAVLLEKSLSRIMLQGRIAPVKRLGGRVIVSDEEGINNVGIMGEESWLARIDSKAVTLVDLYACWGQRDAVFFSAVPGLKKKMMILGNCRSDLLNQIGIKYYQTLITAIRQVFGAFILVNDNFALERLGYHGMARIAADEATQQRLQIEYEQWEKEARIRRKHFTALLRHAAKTLPDQQFVIRPHPRSHPRWWHEHFGAYRNVEVINRHAVEPWIHAASAVISMGCTTGLQALVAGRRVLELATPALPRHGLVSQLMPQHLMTAEDLVSELRQLEKQQQPCNDPAELERNWVNISRSSTKFFARACHQLAADLPRTNASPPPRIEGLVPEPSKWSENPSTIQIKNKATRAAAALNCAKTRVTKVSMGVWQIAAE